MTRVIIDETFRAKLYNLSEPLVLCDQQGQVVGHFVPAGDVSQWEPISPEVSAEELDRRARSNERRYSTDDVLTFLQDIARPEK